MRGTNAYGHLLLEQSSDTLLALLYPEAYAREKKVCVFAVKELKTIGNDLFFILIDAFGLTHIYKPSSRYQSLQPGEEIELYVKCIEENACNKSRLIFEETEVQVVPVSEPVVAVADDSDAPVGEFGEETDKIEFKSTIIYPAGATSPDIDTQMRIILRTIAGFMNAQGGTLHIGVNNNGDAIGIEQDFPLLNSSAKDKYTYLEDKDGYENKIRTGIAHHLSSVAQDHVSITFSVHNGHTVCSVKVEASDRVIWYDERHAYKRTGNRTSHLSDLAIEKLVLDKMKLTLPDAYRIKPTAVQSIDDILPSEPIADSAQEEVPTIVKVAQPELIKKVGEEKQGKGSFYMNLFENGEWSWSKEVPADQDLEYCIPINSPASKNNLVMIYDDGAVNKVAAYQLHLKKEAGFRYPGGRRNDAKLVKVFHAKDEDILACFSRHDGHEFVKIHLLSHVAKRVEIASKGKTFINASAESSICFVAAEHYQRVSALLKTENQTSNCLGFQMDLPKNAKYIDVRDTLKALCDIPAKEV